MSDQTTIDQIVSHVQQSNEVMLLLTENCTKDEIVSAIALKKTLEKMGKKVTAFGHSDQFADLQFLPEVSEIKPKIDAQSLIIALDYDKNSIEKVGYDSVDGKFNLIITPKFGRIDPEKIDFQSEGLKADLIITLGAHSLEAIGDSYRENQEELQSKNIINIDYKENNEFFGAVNLVDSSRTTLSELLFQLVQNLEVDLPGEISNLLLMAMYLGTESFRVVSTNARTFLTVSELIERGADVEYVVKTLYDGQNATKNPQPHFPSQSSANSDVLTDSESPTPFVRGQEDQIKVEEPPVFQNKGEF